MIQLTMPYSVGPRNLAPGAAPRYAPRQTTHRTRKCIETFSSETGITWTDPAPTHSIVTTHYAAGTGALSLGVPANSQRGALRKDAWGADGAGKDLRKCSVKFRFWSDVAVPKTDSTFYVAFYLISDATQNPSFEDVTHTLCWLSCVRIHAGWNEMFCTALGAVGGSQSFTKGASFDITDVTGWAVRIYNQYAAMTLLFDAIELTENAAMPKVAFTFDDGYAIQIVVAALLEARGWRGTFGLSNNWLETTGRMDENTFLELARRGHKIVSHGYLHEYWNVKTLAQIEYDLQAAQAWLYARGLRGDEYIWPGGAYCASDATWGETLALAFRYMSRMYALGLGSALNGSTALLAPGFLSGLWPSPNPRNDPRYVSRYPDEATIYDNRADFAGMIAAKLVAPAASWCVYLHGFGAPPNPTQAIFTDFLDALKAAEDADTIQVVTTDELV